MCRIDVYRPELLDYVTPQSLLSWTRSRVSNFLSDTGEAWAKHFSFEHSGTYVNQWMILDLTRFQPGRDPQPGFLTILEEVPGYIHAEDMTHKLVVSRAKRYDLWIVCVFVYYTCIL